MWIKRYCYHSHIIFEEIFVILVNRAPASIQNNISKINRLIHKQLRFSLKWRIVYLGLAVGLFILAYTIGATLPLSEEQANNIRRGLGEKNKSLNELGIFVNNVVPSLEMFIPGVGVGVGAYAAISTGQVYSAFTFTNPVLKTISPLSLLIAPFAIMEIFAYAIAMSRSGILAYYLVRRRWRHSWKEFMVFTLIEIGIVVLILFIGSIVEWQIILYSRV